MDLSWSLRDAWPNDQSVCAPFVALRTLWLLYKKTRAEKSSATTLQKEPKFQRKRHSFMIKGHPTRVWHFYMSTRHATNHYFFTSHTPCSYEYIVCARETQYSRVHTFLHSINESITANCKVLLHIQFYKPSFVIIYSSAHFTADPIDEKEYS